MCGADNSNGAHPINQLSAKYLAFLVYGMIVRPLMEGIFKDANWRVWLRLLGPFVMSALIGGVLIGIGVRNQWELTKAFGDALLIAGVIGTCLEVFAANRIIEHASSEVAEKMSGYGLPEAARAVIYDLVHNTKRVYRDHHVTYRIERHPVRAGYVIVHATISYRVVNNGRERDAYQPRLEEGINYNPVLESLQFGDEVFTSATIKSETIRTTATFWPDKSVTIAASEANTPSDLLPPDQQCFVRWSYRMEMPEQYSDVTAYTGVTVYPVIELTGKPVDLDFWASEDNNCRHVGDTWRYEQAFVKGQHLRAWWRPRV